MAILCLWCTVHGLHGHGLVALFPAYMKLIPLLHLQISRLSRALDVAVKLAR